MGKAGPIVELPWYYKYRRQYTLFLRQVALRPVKTRI